jgi:hypothetical protein
MRQSDTTHYTTGAVSGPLKGGVAWLRGLPGTHCEDNGKNCGIIEFTLINKGVEERNGFNSINYWKKGWDSMSCKYGTTKLEGYDRISAERKRGMGVCRANISTYPMDFAYTGTCAGAKNGGPCLSEEDCPLTYHGTDTFSGHPTTTLGDNCGVSVIISSRIKSVADY